MGLQNCFQDFHWTITILDGLWESLPLASGAGAQGQLGPQILNFDESLLGEKRKLQLLELKEMRLNAYKSSKIYKQKVKVYHDQKLIKKTF